jgi:hypothetical protein
MNPEEEREDRELEFVRKALRGDTIKHLPYQVQTDFQLLARAIESLHIRVKELENRLDIIDFK